VVIIGLSDGYDSHAAGRKVIRIARGLVNEIYLDDLREKTHRGLSGQFHRGLHVGGVCFGYSSRPSADGHGRELVIDERQAGVVRRIFEDFAAGRSARGIVHALNAEGLASPRGGKWAVSALVGDSKRGAGVLNNELYIGRVVWNRRKWLKDPETGKRRPVDRPRDEWQVRDVPALRIVPAELWEAVRRRQRTGPPRGTRHGGGKAPRTLFAGLLRCPACDGPLVAIDARRYGCSRRNDRGPAACSNSDGYPRATVDGALLAVVRDELLSPAAMTEVQATVRQVLASQAKAGDGATEEARARLRAVRAEIGRLVDAVASMGLSDALRERLAAAERERDDLEVAAARTTPRAAEPQIGTILAGYRRQLFRNSPTNTVVVRDPAQTSTRC
jgi:hypothetical protein